MYQNCHELQLEAESCGSIWRAVLDNEIALTDASEQDIFSRLRLRWEIMQNSAHRALEMPLPTALSLISGVSAPQYRYAQSGGLCGPLLNRIMAYALSCSESNAAMGKICAAPTAGSCGIIPAVLLGLCEHLALSDEDVLHGLLTASGVGAVITRNATVAGAEGGCQAECGVAAAMAAAAAVELSGGTPAQAFCAVSVSLMNCMGLVCDPVAGLVQLPCAQRNASQAINALLSADLALGGMAIPIPVDEVIDAMYSVGKQLPAALRETALGGLAATDTAKHIASNL
jgi:L-serine dehydratase